MYAKKIFNHAMYLYTYTVHITPCVNNQEEYI